MDATSGRLFRLKEIEKTVQRLMDSWTKRGNGLVVRKRKIGKRTGDVALRSSAEGGSPHGVEFQDRYA